jgi:hypothetical protein
VNRTRPTLDRVYQGASRGSQLRLSRDRLVPEHACQETGKADWNEDDRHSLPGALPKRSSRCRGTQSPLNWAASLGHAALQQQAGQGYRDHRGRAAEICPGDPDAERERRPAGDICLAGRIRALGHSAIHRRSAQRQSGGDRDSPEYRSLVEQLGSVAISSTPQEFQKVINETVEKVAPIVQEFSLQLD